MDREKLIELLHKTGKISVVPKEGEEYPTVDITKVRYLLNHTSITTLLGDLNLTIAPGEVVDLYSIADFNKERIASSTAIRDAIQRKLLMAFEDGDEENLLKAIAEIKHIDSPLEKARKTLPEKTPHPIEAVVDPDSNPFQKELERVVEESENIVVGEAPKRRRRRKKKE